MASNPADKLKRFGSMSEIAEHFDTSKEAIRLWLKNGIPTSRALEVEKLTKGEVSALEILRYAAKRESCGA